MLRSDSVGHYLGPGLPGGLGLGSHGSLELNGQTHVLAATEEDRVLYCTVLYCTVLDCTVLYCIVTVLYSHLHALHLHPPGVRGVVQRGFHPLCNLLPAAGQGIEGAVRQTDDCY